MSAPVGGKRVLTCRHYQPTKKGSTMDGCKKGGGGGKGEEKGGERFRRGVWERVTGRNERPSRLRGLM